LLRHLPRGADVDFRTDALVADVNADLANTIGNLVSRVVTLVHKLGKGEVDADALARATAAPAAAAATATTAATAGTAAAAPAAATASTITEQVVGAPIVNARVVHAQVVAALDEFDTATATRLVVDAASAVNRFLDEQRPWEPGARNPELLPVEDVLAQALVACRTLPPLVEPFAPTLASRLAAQLGAGATVGPRGAAFPRLACTSPSTIEATEDALRPRSVSGAARAETLPSS
jgi:methionyl-tRNA synthetase